LNDKKLFSVFEDIGGQIPGKKTHNIGKTTLRLTKKNHTHTYQNPIQLYITDLETKETKYFPSSTEAARKYNKCYTYFTCYSGRVCTLNGKK